MFSYIFRVFDFQVGGPSHNISTCLKGAAATSVRVVTVRHAHLPLSADLGAATMRWSADPITRPIVGDRAVEISQLDCC